MTKTALCVTRVLLRAPVQHPSMDRRGVLVRAVGAISGAVTLAGSGGCVERIGIVNPSLAERERPDRPESLTESSVVGYVAEFEAARTHNVHADAGATAVDLTTTATFDHETDGGYHVTARHVGTVHREEDGGHSADEIRSPPVPYRVTDEETIRLSVERERVETSAVPESADDAVPENEAEGGSEDGNDANAEDGNDETTSTPLGVRLCNVLDRPREMDVEVIRHESSEAVSPLVDGATILDATRTVNARRAIELRGITAVPGTYRVITRVSEDGLTGEGRIDVDLPGVDREPNVDVLSSSEGLSTRPLAAFDSDLS